MKKLPLAIFIFSLVLSSCDLFDLEKNQELSGNFWARDIRTNRDYRVDAELLYTGAYCEIWAEKGSGITVTDAQTIANEYDVNIYQKMIGAFGYTITYNEKSFSNQMKLADSFSSKADDKLCILMLDIRDNYKKGENESFVAGYFNPADLLNYQNSNRRDMIYVDTSPGFKENKSYVYRTLAHEMQHLMNFVTSIAMRTKPSILSIPQMDTWIDEGLSSAAEWVYDGHSKNRIDWFKSNGGSYNSLINKGNNFFVWGNRTNESVYAGQDDYATVYLFFQWLRLQSGSTDIYKNIISSASSNYEAVTNAAQSIDANYSSWDTLLKTWLAANYINAPSGAYGYKGETAFNGMKAPVAPSVTSLNLYPGEAVYSINVQSQPSGQGANIKNAYLTTTLNDNFATGSTLLTYNTNTNKSGAAETGVTTGVAAVSVMRSAPLQNEPEITGPFPIGAGDLLRRFGNDPFVFEFPINGNSGD